jgi:hypothetical protein
MSENKLGETRDRVPLARGSLPPAVALRVLPCVFLPGVFQSKLYGFTARRMIAALFR